MIQPGGHLLYPLPALSISTMIQLPEIPAACRLWTRRDSWAASRGCIWFEGRGSEYMLSRRTTLGHRRYRRQEVVIFQRWENIFDCLKHRVSTSKFSIDIAQHTAADSLHPFLRLLQAKGSFWTSIVIIPIDMKDFFVGSRESSSS